MLTVYERFCLILLAKNGEAIFLSRGSHAAQVASEDSLNLPRFKEPLNTLEVTSGHITSECRLDGNHALSL